MTMFWQWLQVGFKIWSFTGISLFPIGKLGRLMYCTLSIIHINDIDLLLVLIPLLILGWSWTRWVWNWHNLSQSPGQASRRSCVPTSCLCCNWRESSQDGRVCASLAAVSVTLGHGHEYDLQQTGRKHGEVDGAFEGHQVSKNMLFSKCNFWEMWSWKLLDSSCSLSIIGGQRQKVDLCS